MKVLVTGFGPFGNIEVNPSWEAVKLLPAVVGGAEIARVRLPVLYGRAAAMALDEVRRARPDVVICTGVAAGRKAVTPELVAVNWRMASIADAGGAEYGGEKINADMPAALMTSLPVLDMVAAIRDAGLAGQLSLSAGSYVCNDIYWHMLAAEGMHGYRALFVHVPAVEDMPSADAAAALQKCVEVAVTAIAP